MLGKLSASFSSIRKNAYLRIAAVIFAIAIIGFSTVDNYGLSVDEPTEIAIVRRNVELITQGKPIPGDLKYFGTVFDFTAEAAFQIKEYITKGFSYNPLSYGKNIGEEQSRIEALADRIKVKHPVTFLVSLIAYFSIAGIVGIFCGLEYAFLGAIALALFPRFWGHTLFNPKDAPFAAVFTLCTLAGAYLVNHYLQADKQVKIGINRTLIYSALYGILVGLLSSIRIGGFFVLFFIFITHAALILAVRKSVYKEISNLSLSYVLMVVAWMVTTIVLQPASWANLCSPDFPCAPSVWYDPASWRNPIGWFFETIGYLSKHPLQISVLFEGNSIPIQQIPKYYLIKWMAITIPVIFELFFVVGLVFIGFKYSQFSNLQRSCVILVLLQVLLLPLVAIIKHSSDYDEMRHFLFTLPGIAAISTAGLIWIYQKLPNKSLQISAVTLITILFAQIAFDMATLHPYEYIYFNQASGGLSKAQNRYDTDYWGLSMREGMEWLNQNALPNEKIVVAGFLYSARIYANPNSNFNFIDYDDYYNDNEKVKVDKPFYFLAWPRWGAQKYFSECPIAYDIKRQDVPLTIVKRCE